MASNERPALPSHELEMLYDGMVVRPLGLLKKVLDAQHYEAAAIMVPDVEASVSEFKERLAPPVKQVVPATVPVQNASDQPIPAGAAVAEAAT